MIIRLGVVFFSFDKIFYSYCITLLYSYCITFFLLKPFHTIPYIYLANCDVWYFLLIYFENYIIS